MADAAVIQEAINHIEKREDEKGKTAAFGGTSVLAISGSDVEFILNPFNGTLQIGMGGEWWSGPIKPGRNVFRHRKESGDPAYKPVVIVVSDGGEGIHFDVAGGFGYEASFTLSAKGR